MMSAAGTVLVNNVMSPKYADISQGHSYALILANQTAADITTGTFTVQGADADPADPCIPNAAGWAALQIPPDCSPLPTVSSKRVNAAAIAAGGSGHVVGNKITLANGVVLTVATVNAGAITGVTIDNGGSVTGAAPTNPQAQVSSTGPGIGATFNLTWVDVGDASITLSAQAPMKAHSQCAIAVPCPKQFIRIFSQGATNLDLLAVITRLKRTGM
jgi:hypothetical protein